MANVSFKRGLQADLPNSNIVDGAFYLTTDTNRLYVGGANDKLELLNQSIKFYTYDDVFRENSNVPKVEGQFYYLSDKNILCTFAKTKTHPDGEWVQINPDHNDNTLVYVSGLNVTKSNSTEGDTKKLTYTVKLNQEKKESSDGSAIPYGDAITASFEIDSNDLNKIASNVSVGLESNDITNGFELKNSGGGADDSKAVQIKGGDNVTITRAKDGNITIAATDTNTTYDLTSPIGSTNIMLNGGDAGQAPTIELLGDDKIILNGESAGQIAFSHATSSAAARDYNATDVSGNKFSVPQFTVDATGHISNAGLKEITLPEDKDTTYKITNIGVVGSEGKTGKGKLSISLKADGGEVVPTVSTDDVLYHEITIDGKNYTKYNQESLGEFYSTSKVDELITKAAANMNAMTYKGIINGDKFSKIKGSQNGDTYKASADFTINEQQLVKEGDLVIYNGVDLDATADPSANDWDIVPSGNDIDSQFSLSLQKIGDEKKQTALVLTNTTTNEDVGVIEVAGNKGITTIIDGNKLIIAHATESNAAGTVGQNTNLPGAGGTINVPSITYDAQGHITSAEDKTITLPADKDTTYTISTERYGNSDAAVKLKEIGSESGESPTAVFKAGTSIVLDANSNGITIIHGAPNPNAAISNYGQNATAQVDYGETFKVPKFSMDAKGHIVKVEDIDITMPSAQVIPSIEFSGVTNVHNNRATFSSTLSVGDGGANPTYAPSIGSSTLKISGGTDDNVTIDLEWESF